MERSLLKRVLVVILVFIAYSTNNRLYSQCSFLSGNTNENFSSSGVCTGVSVDWFIQYSFIAPVDPNKVFLRYEWNDPSNTVIDIQANCIGQNCSGTENFTYPSLSNDCGYAPRVTLAWDQNGNGNVELSELCPASEINKSISSWSTDNAGSGSLSLSPALSQYCVGISELSFQFQDATFPNCSPLVTSSPNQLTRWVQFVYGTNNQVSTNIPNVYVDVMGTPVQITDNAGNVINQLISPVIEIPPLVSASDLNELTYPISYGSNTTIGQKFEVTLRNWNICNPYDSLPFNGSPPNDIVNGDNAPVTTSSHIDIIGPTYSNAGADQIICGSSTILTANAAIVGTGTWQQISGPGTLNINNLNSESSAISVTGNDFGTYSMEWLINLGTCVSRDTVNITFNQSPTIPVTGPDQSICGLGTNLLANIPTVGTGQWVQTAGPTGVIISNANDPQSGISVTNYGVYTFEWRINNANCPVLTDAIQVSFFDNPSSADAGSDQFICGNSTLLNAVPLAVGNGQWLVTSSPNGSNPTLSNIGSAVSGFQSDSFGVYNLQWTASSGNCPSNSDNVLITFAENPSSADAGADQFICGLTANMQAIAPANGNGSWSQISGPSSVSFSDFQSPTANINASVYGTYTLQWQISNGICPANTDQVNITFYDNPSISNAGPDQTICGTAAILGASPVSVGTGTWSLLSSPLGSNPVISSVLSRTSTFITDSAGVYELLWTISNGNCNGNSDTVQITFYSTPDIPVAGPDQVVCALSTNLVANSPVSGNGQWVQVAGPSGLIIANPSSSTSSITAVNYGVYTLEWRISNGNCPVLSDQIQITFQESPSAANAGPDQLVCGLNASMKANSIAVGTGQWTVLNSPAGSNPIIGNIASPLTSISTNVFGVYIFQWTSSNGTCLSNSDLVKITFVENPSFNVLSQLDARCFDACDGSASLQASAGTAPFYFQWKGPKSFNGTSSTDLCAGNYQVVMTDNNGCQFTGSVIIDDPDSISTSYTVVQSSCENFDGSINLTASGGTGTLNFRWNTGRSTEDIDSLAAGLYLVTIKDQNNCQELVSVNINDIGGPTLTLGSITEVSCFGERDGAIDVQSNNPNTTYLWSNGANSQDIINLEYGPYQLMAEDTTDNCKSFLQVFVPQPESLDFNLTLQNSTCGSSDGSASIVISGGNGGNIINWSTGTTGSSVSGLNAAVYSVTVNDFKGCSVTSNFAISDIGAPFIFLDSITNVTCGQSNGALKVSTTGNSSTYSYLWSTGDSTDQISGLNVGTYSLQVIDTLGCESYFTQDIIQVSTANPQICMVRVDSLDPVTHINQVVWQKIPNKTAYDYFNVYRESTSAGLYQLIGTVNADSLGLFSDPTSNPFVRSYRYKISVVDTCGVESNLSNYHKTIHLVQNIGLATNSINLIWDDYEGFSYSTYYIYRNSQTQGWELIDSVSSNVNSYTDVPPFSINDPDLFYAVKINNLGGCDPNKDPDYNRTRSNPSSKIFDPEAPVGFNHSMAEKEIGLFPNPGKDNLFISGLKEIENVQFSIFEINGILIKTGEIGGNKSIDIQELNSGFYQIQIQSKNQNWNLKFIKLD